MSISPQVVRRQLVYVYSSAQMQGITNAFAMHSHTIANTFHLNRHAIAKFSTHVLFTGMPACTKHWKANTIKQCISVHVYNCMWKCLLLSHAMQTCFDKCVNMQMRLLYLCIWAELYTYTSCLLTTWGLIDMGQITMQDRRKCCLAYAFNYSKYRSAPNY